MISRAPLLAALATMALGACQLDSAGPAVTSEPVVQASQAAHGRGAAGVIYVTSQGLYYDTYVSAETLPMNGPFQLLEDGSTEFGPGDAGYLGGRWWEDLNHNGMQDEGDHFFLCPLLPPGRSEP